MDNAWISWQELDRLLAEKDLILFGAGHPVRYTLNKTGKSPLMIADNNQDKHNTTFYDVIIKEPKELLPHKETSVILITTPLFESVAKQLDEMGFEAGKHYFCSPALNNFQKINELKSVNQTILFTCGDTPDPGSDTSGGGLYKFNFETKELEKLYNGKFHELVKMSDKYYIVDEIEGIIVLDSTFKVVNKFKILPWAVPHGLAADEEKKVLYIANTGIDSITVMDAETGTHIEEIHVSDDMRQYQLDRHHINDLCLNGKHLYISMFSFSGLWEKGCYDGGIAQLDLDKKKIISYPVEDKWMPHSIMFINGELTYAESMTGTVFKTSKKKLFESNGFIRGIAYDGRYFYIGQSEHRYLDRMAGISHNIQINCGIHVFDETTKANRFYSFDAMKNIHSIMVL